MLKTVLVTGCNGGIGQAIVAEFKKRGWRVFGVDLQEDADQPIDIYYQSDVSSPEQWQSIAVEVENQGINLQCLVNNAAVHLIKPLVDTSIEEWRRVISTNLSSMFFGMKYLYPHLQEGAVVNIASVHGRATSPGMAAYVTSKGGVVALSRAAALEWGEKGIRVNCVLPGAIETSMLKKGLERVPGTFEIAKEQLRERVPLQRIGVPEDVAALTYFLAEPSLSGYITGQEFICDGGVLARLSSE